MVGVPGRVVKATTDEQRAHIRQNAASYVELAGRYRLMPRSVVVVGSGVAGCQAALDLANHGLQVHLVEREPSIGGRMAQLDKTFPTNDCSMCILSPKMVDVERHPLIRVLTPSPR